MPPKVKITKQDIIDTALAQIRAGGENTLNARGIAAALNCSTQPIFSNFATMEELQAAVMGAAHAYYLSFLQREIDAGNYPPYKSMGMAYIRFAKEEKALFRLLFMCDRAGKDLVPTADFRASVDIIMQANGVSRETAELMHLEMWTCVHGIAAMLATSFFALEWELISQILTDVYQGLRARHASKEEEQ